MKFSQALSNATSVLSFSIGIKRRLRIANTNHHLSSPALFNSDFFTFPISCCYSAFGISCTSYFYKHKVTTHDFWHRSEMLFCRLWKLNFFIFLHRMLDRVHTVRKNQEKTVFLRTVGKCQEI